MEHGCNRRHGAFTLIELLVVISIIGLLASIIIVNLDAAQARGRDAKRKEELYSIKNALFIYYSTYGKYPPAKPQTACGGGDSWAESNGTCGGQWLTTDPNFYTIMPSVPVDPVNTGGNAGWGDGNYVYSYAPSLANDQDYELITQLESPSDPDRCGSKPAYYHNVVPNIPWCAPWPNNMGRSQNIYSDH